MIVIARRYGQLGNRLFLYAHLMAAARHYGVDLLNPCFAEYANLFPSTQNDLWCRYSPHSAIAAETTSQSHRPPRQRTRNGLMHSVQAVAKTLNAVGLRHYPFEIIRLKSGEQCDLQGDRFRSAIESGRTLLLQGWMFRSGELLNEQWTQVREFFRLSQADRTKVDATVAAARRECDVLVGVHVRRGDYANFQGGRYFYDDQHYAGWMHQIVEQMPGRRVGFLVCTHEPLNEACYAGLSITRGPGSAICDMYALAETDFMIGPPSTFTAWAAYIGRKPRVELSSCEQTVVVPAAGHHWAA